MADNAIRYDDVKLLKKSETCYSMNTEAVDLNAYLYQEKEIIVKMAKLLNEKEIAEKYEKEKEILDNKFKIHFLIIKQAFSMMLK